MKYLGVVSLYLSLCFFQSHAQGLSQKRYPGETFEQAVERVNQRLPEMRNAPLLLSPSPYTKKVLVKNMDFSKVTEVESLDELQTMFELIRDSRFLISKKNPGFSRRISWLYPDDGCYARAAVAGMKMHERKMKRPLKIFAFGELEVNTPYAPKGSVTWWYHVALVVKYMGSYYVLDPAVNPRKPILYEEWYQAMGNMANLKGVVCEAYTYDANGSCVGSKKEDEARASSDQEHFLEEEWKRMKALGFDPIRLLGAYPPWLPN